MRTTTKRQRLLTVLFIGVVIGIIGAIVKFGWEVPFPPRTPYGI
jgi:putative membrane protein